MLLMYCGFTQAKAGRPTAQHSTTVHCGPGPQLCATCQAACRATMCQLRHNWADLGCSGDVQPGGHDEPAHGARRADSGITRSSRRCANALERLHARGQPWPEALILHHVGAQAPRERVAYDAARCQFCRAPVRPEPDRLLNTCDKLTTRLLPETPCLCTRCMRALSATCTPGHKWPAHAIPS